jgi:NAD(P)H dehydrogenase (quinone)
MTDQLIGVTGATGSIGGGVAQRLARRGVAQRLIVRDADRAPRLDGAEVRVTSGFADAEQMQAALEGVHTLLFVSGGESATRVAEQRTALDAAVAAGVAHVVYLSVVGAADPKATFTLVRDHHATEEHLRSLPVAHTMVRDSLYLDFVPQLVGADGVVRGPAGNGAFGGVARDDVTDALAAILADPAAHAGAVYELTGPRTITLQEAADLMSEVSGRTIGYYNEPIQEAFESRMDPDVEDWQIDAWVTTYLAIARGEFDLVTEDVQQLTGHPPQDFAQVLAAHPDALAHVTAT